MARIMFVIFILFFSCSIPCKKKESFDKYFLTKKFKRSIRNWDTFYYNCDTTEFYFSTNNWNFEGIPQYAKIILRNGICQVNIYHPNFKNKIMNIGRCKLLKHKYHEDDPPFSFIPIHQYSFYPDSVWKAYDINGEIESKEIYKYNNDTLILKRIYFDTIEVIKKKPFPIIGPKVLH